MKKTNFKEILILSVIFSFFLCKNIFGIEKIGRKEYTFKANLTDEEIRKKIYDDIDNKFEIISIEIEYLKGDFKEFEKTEEKIVESSKNVISNFEHKIEFDEKGYKGELLRMDDTLIVAPNSNSVEDIDVTQTYAKTYTSLPDNDVINIPKIIKEEDISMNLVDLKFMIAGYEIIGEYKIPNLYDAIATYNYTTKTTRNVTNTYKASILYKNDLQYHIENKAIVKFKTIFDNEKNNLIINEKTVIDINESDSKSGSEFIKAKEEKTGGTLKFLKAFFKVILTIPLIILFIILIIIIISLVIYFIYLLLFRIKIYNITDDSIIFLNRTKILKKKGNIKINLSPFDVNSLLFKITMPKNLVKKYNEKFIQILIQKHDKTYIRNILIKKNEVEYLFNF